MEVLPDMMLMGISEEKFWNSTMRQIKPYGELYKKRQFEEDRILHRMGAYVYEAVGIAIANAFSGKKGKKYSYRENPYSFEAQEERTIEKMTEEEKTDKVEQIFAMLAGGQES